MHSRQLCALNKIAQNKIKQKNKPLRTPYKDISNYINSTANCHHQFQTSTFQETLYCP